MPPITLVGTSLGGSGSFATVRRAQGQVQLLRVGDRIDGLTVTAVDSNRIVLSQGEGPPVVIEIDRPAAQALRTPPRAGAAPAAQPTEQPTFAEGEAPWDAGPNFRH